MQEGRAPVAQEFVAKFTDPHTERGIVATEARGSSHHWGRQFGERDYRVRLVPPQFVAQRRVGDKNDGNMPTLFTCLIVG